MRRAGTAGLVAAMGFLTAVPVPEAVAGRGASHATAHFPLVGALLGLVAATVEALPVDPPEAGALALGVVFLLTGGLHWDGLADVLDATVTPGMSRARRMEILSDSRVGAHAVVGSVLTLVLAVSALTRAPAWGVVLGSALGRWSMVATLRWAPPLRAEGSGAHLRCTARVGGATLAQLVVLLVLALAGAPVRFALLVTVAGMAAAAAVAALLAARLGGLNGDGHGTVGLVMELTAWSVAAELTGSGG